jgi:hypothetical protein
MTLDLDEGDAAALAAALGYHIDALTHELTRTEQHELQHELAATVARLEKIRSRVPGSSKEPADRRVALL